MSVSATYLAGQNADMKKKLEAFNVMLDALVEAEIELRATEDESSGTSRDVLGLIRYAIKRARATK